MSEKSIALRLAMYWTMKNDQGEYIYSSLDLRESTAIELRRLHEENEALRVARDTMGNLWAKEKAHNSELSEVMKSTGLFLHHLWCDVQMNDYSFQKLNEQMEIVDKVLKK